ncbi:hypothetical protein M3Y97_00794900 [Aphelenchoides bicaudatus]|nr:hypothetical protein M3Y97_00794900 [Aphelenchoides bicaudatus]
MVASAEDNVPVLANVPDEVNEASCSSSDYECTVTGNQLSTFDDYELISTFLDIRCFCHVNLLHAKIRIIHEEHTGAVVLWLLSGHTVVLNIRAEFDYVHNKILINANSYGFAEPQHSIRIPLNDCIHFYVHVYHKNYLFQVNGIDTLQLNHRLPFHYVEQDEIVQRCCRGRRRQPYERKKNRVLPY